MDDYQKLRLQHEIEVVSKLNHPNVIKFYELFEDEKRFYLVMEKIDGKELYDALYD